jgi:hypothetical protein
VKRFGLLLALTVAVWLETRGPCLAAPAQNTVVASQACDTPFDAGQAWIALLRVELADDGVDVLHADRTTPANSALVEAKLETNACGPEARSVILTVSQGQSAHSRTLDLATIADVAEARVVAIAMAGLVRATLADERARTTTAPELPETKPTEAPTGTTARPALSHPPPPSRKRWQFLAAGEGRFFVQGSLFLAGARVGVTRDLARYALWTVDAGVLVGKQGDALGDVRSVVTLLGTSVLFGSGTTVRWGTGPRVEAGVGRFRGLPLARRSTGSTAHSSLVFAGLSGALTFPLRGPCSGHVALDAGATVRGFYGRAERRRLADMRGAMLSLRLGLSY